MGKCLSNVRFRVNSNNQDAFLEEIKSFNISDYEGALSHQVVDCGDGKFFTTIQWESREALIKSRSALVSFLDSVRPLLEEISPELGVTDPISGEIIFETFA